MRVGRGVRNRFGYGVSAANHLPNQDADTPLRETPVHAKFDVDVVDWFKAQGCGRQTCMNAVSRRYMEAHRKAG
jgi:uncharacterized protein (DUF4415 family)